MLQLNHRQTYIGRKVCTEAGKVLGYVRQVQNDPHPEVFWLLLCPTSISWIPSQWTGLYQMSGSEILQIHETELIVKTEARYRLTPVIKRWWNRGKVNPPWHQEEDLPLSIRTQINGIADYRLISISADPEIQQMVAELDGWNNSSTSGNYVSDQGYTDEWYERLDDEEDEPGLPLPKRPNGPNPPPLAGEAEAPID